jgi:hypothetical protein
MRPWSVDFGTASDLKFRDAKHPVFLAAGCGWDQGDGRQSYLPSVLPHSTMSPNETSCDLPLFTVLARGAGLTRNEAEASVAIRDCIGWIPDNSIK